MRLGEYDWANVHVSDGAAEAQSSRPDTQRSHRIAVSVQEPVDHLASLPDPRLLRLSYLDAEVVRELAHLVAPHVEAGKAVPNIGGENAPPLDDNDCGRAPALRVFGRERLVRSQKGERESRLNHPTSHVGTALATALCGGGAHAVLDALFKHVGKVVGEVVRT